VNVENVIVGNMILENRIFLSLKRWDIGSRPEIADKFRLVTAFSALIERRQA